MRGRKLNNRIAVIIANLLKFIPVRGRKLFEFSQIIEHDVEIYPREGTETGWPSHQFVLEHELKFIPVRGRKLSINTLHAYILWLKFIPVRGRKRIATWIICIVRNVEIYPREGTETRRCASARSRCLVEI